MYSSTEYFASHYDDRVVVDGMEDDTSVSCGGVNMMIQHNADDEFSFLPSDVTSSMHIKQEAPFYTHHTYDDDATQTSCSASLSVASTEGEDVNAMPSMLDFDENGVDGVVPLIGGMEDEPMIKYEPQSTVITNADLSDMRSRGVDTTPQPPIVVVKLEGPSNASSITAPSSQHTPMQRRSTKRAASPSSVASSHNSSAAGVSSTLTTSSGSNSGASSAMEEDDDDEIADAPTPTRRGAQTKATRKRKSAPKDDASESANGANMGDDEGIPLAGDKRTVRLQRNRASAQLSRERKKAYVTLLEKQLRDLAECNEHLTTQVAELTKENTELKTRLSKLIVRERVQGRYRQPPAAPQPLTHTNSVESSGSSVPTTPMTVSSDDSTNSANVTYPLAKKLKVAAYQSPTLTPSTASTASPRSGGSSSSSGSFNARTSMLLFTLVCTVGLFSIIGLDMTPSGTSRSPVVVEVMDEPNFATSAGIRNGGRVLQSLDMQQPQQSQRLLPLMSASTGAPEKSLSSSNNIEQDAFALVPLDATSTTTSPASTSRALDVYKQSVDRDGDETMLSATPHRDATSAGGCDLAFLSHLLRRLGHDGVMNLTSYFGESNSMLNEKVLYAPHARYITKDLWHGLIGNANDTSSSHATTHLALSDVAAKSTDEVTTSSRGRKKKRSRSASKKSDVESRLRNRLPLPTSSSTSHALLPSPNDANVTSDETIQIPNLHSQLAYSNALQVGDKLLLWMPVSDSTINVATPSHNASTTTSTGLVEVACHISHVRPITTADIASP